MGRLRDSGRGVIIHAPNTRDDYQTRVIRCPRCGGDAAPLMRQCFFCGCRIDAHGREIAPEPEHWLAPFLRALGIR